MKPRLGDIVRFKEDPTRHAIYRATSTSRRGVWVLRAKETPHSADLSDLSRTDLWRPKVTFSISERRRDPRDPRDTLSENRRATFDLSRVVKARLQWFYDHEKLPSDKK